MAKRADLQTARSSLSHCHCTISPLWKRSLDYWLTVVAD